MATLASNQTIDIPAKLKAPKIPLSKKLVVGGISGVIGISSTFPIDMVKTQLQVHVGNFNGPIQCFRYIVSKEGVRGLYRGLSPAVVGVMPEKALKLACNDYFKELLGEDENHSLPLSLQIVAASSAGFFQCLATTPMEMVKIQLQTQTSLPLAQQQTTMQVVRSLGISGMYKGYSATLIRDVPYAAIFFPSYEIYKSILSNDSKNPGVLPTLVAGGSAGATAALFSTPADVIKTRFQMRGSNYKNVFECARAIIKENGAKSLLNGAVPRMFVQAPLFGITILAFELQKSYMKSQQ